MDSHGAAKPIDVAVWLGADSALALVEANASEWSAAHPCECEALCECDTKEDADGEIHQG